MPFKNQKPANKKVLTFKSKTGTKNAKNGERQNKSLSESMNNLSLEASSTRRAPDAFYISNLIVSKRHFALSRNGYYAVADCDVNGRLITRYCIVQKIYFTDGKDHDYVFVCSCDNNLQTKLRLSSCSRTIHYEPLTDFVTKERANYCIHLKHIDRLEECNSVSDEHVTDSAPDDNDDVCVDHLSSSPLIIAVYCDNSAYGIIPRDRSGKVRMRCQTCTSNVYACDHISAYRHWAQTQNIEIDMELNFHDDTETTTETTCTYPSVSTANIPYPLPGDMQRRFDEYETQRRQFPTRFIPNIPNKCCEHGNKWDTRDPVDMQWIISSTVMIHKMHGSINSDDGDPMFIYYIPTTGQCKCITQYDGQCDLLFNLDNKNLIYYGVLFQYLHTMIQTGNPLVSVHRHMYFTNKTTSQLDIVPLHILRRAWNTFARLLNIDLSRSFQCKECGPNPTVIICDGTDVGMRKDFLPQVKSRINGKTSSLPTITGIAHKDRTYIKSASCRRLLQKLSGDKKHQRRNLTTIKPVSPVPLNSLEVEELKQLLRTEKKEGLIELVEEVVVENIVQPHYRVLFSELAKNTPVYGILQTGANHKCLEVLAQILESRVNVRQSVYSAKMALLQEQLPVMAYVLAGCTDTVPSSVCKVLQGLLNMYNHISSAGNTDFALYSDIEENRFDVFPTLPAYHGKGRYKQDEYKQKQTEECRKDSWGHPTLTPGIFTIYCSHGVCYGFTVMENCESPKQPFDIFTCRFEKAPEVIVYDNACKLKYCLLREPAFFKNTIFVVDRFHWKGHVGCSLGYNLSLYLANTMLKNINSQINEQGNVGIQKLKGHLSYMSFNNFKFHVTLYYAVRNLNIIDGLSYYT